MRIVSLQQLDGDAIRQIVPDAEVVIVDDADAFAREARNAEVAVGVTPESFALLAAEPSRLKWAHTSVAGANRFIGDALRSGVVTLTCAKGGAAGRNLAEHALGLALAVSRNIGEASRSKSWRRTELSDGPFELSGNTAGIIGYGGAGRDLARLLEGFDMDLLAVKRTPPVESDSGRRIKIELPSMLNDVIRRSDVIFNLLPLTNETERLFGSQEFSAMRNHAIFVNVGRGETVNTDALTHAVEHQEIFGAGIDAVDPEPLPPDHRLWTLSRVVISPHIAGVSPDRRIRNELAFLKNLRRFRDGEPLHQAVDPNAGY